MLLLSQVIIHFGSDETGMKSIVNQSFLYRRYIVNYQENSTNPWYSQVNTHNQSIKPWRNKLQKESFD